MNIPTSPDGTCVFKRDKDHDCTGGRVSGPAICNWIGNVDRSQCPRYFYEAGLRRIAPAEFCCAQMESVFHLCAESSGYMAGAFDLHHQVSDGKLVQRNFERVKFVFCPFCGKRLIEEQTT